MRIIVINQQMNTNRTKQNSSANNNNINFGTKLFGAASLKRLIPNDHPLIALLRVLAKDGEDRVWKFSWGDAFGCSSKPTARGDDGTYFERYITRCLDPHLNLTPSLKRIGAKKREEYLRLLQKWHKGPKVGGLQNISHKVTYTANNPSHGHFKMPGGHYSFSDAGYHAKAETIDRINQRKKEFAIRIANRIVRLLKASEKLDAPVLKSLRDTV